MSEFEDEVRVLVSQRPWLTIGQAVQFVDAVIAGVLPPHFDPPSNLIANPSMTSVKTNSWTGKSAPTNWSDKTYVFTSWDPTYVPSFGKYDNYTDLIHHAFKNPDVVGYIKDGNTIMAIKELRMTASGVSFLPLKVAKEAVLVVKNEMEAMVGHLLSKNVNKEPAVGWTEQTLNNPYLFASLIYNEPKVAELLEACQYIGTHASTSAFINMIKEIRKITACSLKQAKLAADVLRYNPTDVGGFTKPEGWVHPAPSPSPFF